MAKEAKEGGVRPTAAKYKVPRSSIQHWMKLSPTTPTGRKQGSGRKLTYSLNHEDKIITWVLQQREQHIPVSQEIFFFFSDLGGDEFTV